MMPRMTSSMCFLRPGKDCPRRNPPPTIEKTQVIPPAMLKKTNLR